MLFLIPIIGPFLALGAVFAAFVTVSVGGVLDVSTSVLITHTVFPVSGLLGLFWMALAF